MLTISYKKSRSIRMWATLATLTILGLLGYKLYAGYVKIQDFQQANLYLQQNDLVQAHAYFGKAEKNRWLLYKEDEIAAASAKLKPVEEIRNTLRTIKHNSSGDNDPAQPHADYQAFVQAAASKGGQYQEIFDELNTQYDMYSHFTNAYANYRQTLERHLQEQIKKAEFSNETVTAFLRIPDSYFGGTAEKGLAIRTALAPYDQAQLDRQAAKKGFGAVLEEGTRLMKFYENAGINENWVYPSVEQYALSSLKRQQENQNFTAFFNDSHTFERSKGIAALGGAVKSYIQSVFTSQLKQAEKLVDGGKYEEAIDAYTLLGEYKDMQNELQNVELKWNLNEPLRILEKTSPDTSFDYVSSGRDQLGALVYAIGTTNGKLILARMLPDRSMDSKVGTLSEDFRAREIRIDNSLSLTGRPVLLMEGSSSSRQARYAAYEIGDSTLHMLFDFEADSFKVEKKGTLVVSNDTGEGADQDAFYSYQSGQYHYSGIKPDYVEIRLADLPAYSQQKVRFTCEILTADGGTAVVLFNEEYVLLTGASDIQPGRAVITGTWVGNTTVTKGEQEINAYLVEVSSFTQ